jgi:hypothetical protein
MFQASEEPISLGEGGFFSEGLVNLKNIKRKLANSLRQIIDDYREHKRKLA